MSSLDAALEQAPRSDPSTTGRVDRLRCCACGCRLPPDLFSKSQRKKAAGTGKCTPCVGGVPRPSAPPTPPAALEEGYCLTMHQPWASLVVSGIKRLEGRSWRPDAFAHGGLWIHSAAHEPDPEDIALVEAQYRQLYNLEGVGGALQFPATYPTRCLLGCVDVPAVLAADDLRRLDLTPSLGMVRGHLALPRLFPCSAYQCTSVPCARVCLCSRQESEADFVFLCQNPRRLVMRCAPRCFLVACQMWADGYAFDDTARVLGRCRRAAKLGGITRSGASRSPSCSVPPVRCAPSTQPRFPQTSAPCSGDCASSLQTADHGRGRYRPPLLLLLEAPRLAPSRKPATSPS